MTEAEFLAARALMAEAVERAELILGFIEGDDETARVELLEDGRAMMVSWIHDCDGYLERCTQEFPSHLLFCSIDEVKAWEAEQKRVAEYKDAENRRTYQAILEAQERAAYEALKAKYG